MGRLRRASSKPRQRPQGLTRFAEDEDTLENIAHGERSSSTGESLLSKFNRLARDTTDQTGVAGEVVGFDGSQILARTDDGHEQPCQMRRVLKKMLHGVKNPIAVGDRVRLEFTEQDEAVIVAIDERENQLARADSHNKALTQVFAANVDHLVTVSAVVEPTIRTGLIDRYLVIAHQNDIHPLIVINKIDLADAGDIPTLYRQLGYEVFTTCAADPSQTAAELGTLRETLRGKRCVFAGHSGVGKSSLINALYPDFAARTGAVSQQVQKGRHTTTAARSYVLPDNGRLIDTPGIRECGISGLTAIDVALFYPEIAQRHHSCRFNDCTHIHEPDCAIRDAVSLGEIDPRRYESYLGIITEDLGDS